MIHMTESGSEEEEPSVASGLSHLSNDGTLGLGDGSAGTQKESIQPAHNLKSLNH